MDNRNTNAYSGTVYLDEITLTSSWRLLFVRGINTLIVLEKISKIQRFWVLLFQMRRVQVKEAIFFAGDLKTKDGEAITFPAFRQASIIALKASKQIVRSENELCHLNEIYGRNTIQLFIAKQLHLHIIYWTLRAMVVQALCSESRTEVWLRRPQRFDQAQLAEAFPGINFHFYRIVGFGNINLIITWILDVARQMKLRFGLISFSRRFIPPKTDKPSVLMLQENTNIRADRRLRAQPHHWLNGEEPPKEFNTYLVETRIFKIAATEEDKLQLSKEGVTILHKSVFISATKAMRNNSTLRRIRRRRHALIRDVFKATGFANKFFLLQVALLLKRAEMIGSLALWLNTKVFLNREPQFIYADAMQLVGEELNICTIAYQYSNMGFLSPIMMSTADKFLIFSDMYKVIFQTEDISPGEFISTGYLYDGVARFFENRTQEHRKKLNQAGAKFIICFFDESVQDGRWGLVSKKEHLEEIRKLAETIIADPTMGLIVKSQYMRNSPSQMYPDDKIIEAAKATGRYLELMEGVHRNEIYPTEAALAADLCIGHKFGATAALEAAIAGVRTVLLDSYGTRKFSDSIYAQADIVYASMDSILMAIAGMRKRLEANEKLGDWSHILHHFDPFRDGKAADRLFNIINNQISASGKTTN